MWAQKPTASRGRIRKKRILPLLHTRRCLSKLAAFNGERKEGWRRSFFFAKRWCMNSRRMVSVVAIAIAAADVSPGIMSPNMAASSHFSFSFPKKVYRRSLNKVSSCFLLLLCCSMVLFLTLLGGCFQGYPSCCNERGEGGEGRWLCSFATFNVDTFQRCPATPNTVTRNVKKRDIMCSSRCLPHALYKAMFNSSKMHKKRTLVSHLLFFFPATRWLYCTHSLCAKVQQHSSLSPKINFFFTWRNEALLDFFPVHTYFSASFPCPVWETINWARRGRRRTEGENCGGCR